jgi:nucleoside-diphosphate-sugar epimerase
MDKELVLVTGGSGYIATYIMMALIRQGYRVRLPCARFRGGTR